MSEQATIIDREKMMQRKSTQLTRWPLNRALLFAQKKKKSLMLYYSTVLSVSIHRNLSIFTDDNG